MKFYNKRSELAKMKEMPEQGTTKKFSLFVDEFQENFNVDASVSATSIIIGISFGGRSMSISSSSGKGSDAFSKMFCRLQEGFNHVYLSKGSAKENKPIFLQLRELLLNLWLITLFKTSAYVKTKEILCRQNDS